MKTPYYFSFLALILLSLPSVAFGKEVNSLFDLLSQQKVLELKLVTSLARLSDNELNTEYQPAQMLFSIAEKSYQLKVKVKSRGRYRRRVCDFPPLKLNFDKDDLKAMGLAKFDKLKLVSHCMDEKSISKEKVIREFLAYELFREVSEYSLRVQLIQITYIDELKPSNRVKRWGFLIEDIDELAHRVGAEEIDTIGMSPSSLDAAQLEKVYVFQYMIGNTDWDVRMSRNVKILQMKESGSYLPVPYDFDFAGLVDAPYAVPNPDYQVQTVKDRVYLGEDRENPHLAPTLSFFHDKKDLFLKRVDHLPEINKEARLDMTSYLQSFFEKDVLRISELSHRNQKAKPTAPEVLQPRGN